MDHRRRRSNYYANERMAELLRTSLSEMIGQPSFAYLFPADVEAAQHLFDVKKGGAPNPFRFRLRKKDGSAQWLQPIARW